MAFTKEEFEIMVEELLYREPISFDMLCHIVEKTLRKKVVYLCQMPDLRGRDLENDIMQEIQIKLMKITITGFLLKDGVGGPVNNDPKGFERWIKTVGQNCFRDYIKKVRGWDSRIVDIDDESIKKMLGSNDDNLSEEHKAKLKKMFSMVLSANSNIYKILTWVAQFVFIVACDVSKIHSTEKMVEIFGEKTLFEMYDTLYRLSEYIGWVEITKEQDEKILKALNKQWKENVVFGDVPYKEFFMVVNGQKNGKKSISDWVNRMNNMICRNLGKDIYSSTTNSEEGR